MLDIGAPQIGPHVAAPPVVETVGVSALHGTGAYYSEPFKSEGEAAVISWDLTHWNGNPTVTLTLQHRTESGPYTDKLANAINTLGVGSANVSQLKPICRWKITLSATGSSANLTLGSMGWFPGQRLAFDRCTNKLCACPKCSSGTTGAASGDVAREEGVSCTDGKCDCPVCDPDNDADLGLLAWASTMAQADSGQSDFWKIAHASEAYIRSSNSGMSQVSTWVSENRRLSSLISNVSDQRYSVFMSPGNDDKPNFSGKVTGGVTGIVIGLWCICIVFEFVNTVRKYLKTVYERGPRRVVGIREEQFRGLFLYTKMVPVAAIYEVNLDFYHVYQVTETRLKGMICIGFNCPPNYLKLSKKQYLDYVFAGRLIAKFGAGFAMIAHGVGTGANYTKLGSDEHIRNIADTQMERKIMEIAEANYNAEPDPRPSMMAADETIYKPK